MNEIMEQLFQLQQAETGAAANTPESEQRIEGLRKVIPEPILGHYDRLRARGKTGVAMVRAGVCGGCHMRLASGVHAALIRADDLIICDSCGRYLKAAPEAPAAPVVAPKKRGRRSKVASMGASGS